MFEEARPAVWPRHCFLAYTGSSILFHGVGFPPRPGEKGKHPWFTTRGGQIEEAGWCGGDGFGFLPSGRPGRGVIDFDSLPSRGRGGRRFAFMGSRRKLGVFPFGRGIASAFPKVPAFRTISVARRADSNCSIVRGPMIGAVTMGLCKSQARATAAGGSPSCLQRASSCSSLARFSLISFRVSSLVRRPLCSFSRAPARRPPPRGLQGISPRP